MVHCSLCLVLPQPSDLSFALPSSTSTRPHRCGPLRRTATTQVTVVAVEVVSPPTLVQILTELASTRSRLLRSRQARAHYIVVTAARGRRSSSFPLLGDCEWGSFRLFRLRPFRSVPLPPCSSTVFEINSRLSESDTFRGSEGQRCQTLPFAHNVVQSCFVTVWVVHFLWVFTIYKTEDTYNLFFGAFSFVVVCHCCRTVRFF